MRYCVKTFQLVLVIGLFSLIAIPVTAEERVRLTIGEWPPFTSEKLKDYGVYSHIVSEAFALEGVKVEYAFFPWARGYDNVVRGVWDGSLTWAPTPDKEKEVLFSDPVVMHTKVFFHLKSIAFDWSTFDDLIGLEIGVTAKYTYGDDFDQAAKDGRIHVDYATSDVLNLKKLYFGRFQIFPSDIDVGYNLLNSGFTSEEVKLFTHHPKPIQETFTCVIFSKKNPEKSRHLLELFNRGLEKLKKRGTYDKLLEASRRGEYRQEIID